MYPMVFNNRACIIQDKLNKKTIAIGVIQKVKWVPFACISLDNVYFFPVKENARRKITLLGTEEEFPYYLNIPSDWTVLPWAEAVHDEEPKADVYKEKFLDKEVERLVYALNHIKGITTNTSCSGHGDRPPFISISFSDFTGLNFLLRFFEKHKDDWRITTHKELAFNFSNKSISLVLISDKMGDKIYSIMDKIAYKILREAEEEGLYTANEKPLFGLTEEEACR